MENLNIIPVYDLISYAECLPEISEEVICFNPAWIDEDFNPKGIRIGFRTDDDFITAYYWNYQDSYMTISHSECDNKEFYSDKIRNNVEPTHWKKI